MKPIELILVTKIFIAEEVAHVTYGLLVLQIQLIMREKYNCSCYYTEIKKGQKHMNMIIGKRRKCLEVENDFYSSDDLYFTLCKNLHFT